jgi:hypothetical protein
MIIREENYRRHKKMAINDCLKKRKWNSAIAACTEEFFMKKKGFAMAGMVALVLAFGVGAVGCGMEIDPPPRPKSIRITKISLPTEFANPASAYIWIGYRDLGYWDGVGSWIWPGTRIYAIARFPGAVTDTVTLALKCPTTSKRSYISDADWNGPNDDSSSIGTSFGVTLNDTSFDVILVPFVNGTFDTDHALEYPKGVSFDDDTLLVTLDFTAFEKVVINRR